MLRHPGLGPGSTKPQTQGKRLARCRSPQRGPRTKSGVTAGVWLGATLLLAACAPVPQRTGGIVSTNPCADAILAVVAPDRLAAVSHYSHDPAATSMPLALARRWPATSGTAEEVIARRPDLVVTDSFAPAASREAYARAGLKVLTLDIASTIPASEAQVMALATAAGHPARGRALVRAIERAIPPATGPRPAALLYIAGDLANGGGTLLDALMQRAGLRNAAADYGLAFTGTLPIETIAAHPPRVILSDDDGRSAALRRRVLARVSASTVEAHFPRRLMNCGGSALIPALHRLAAIRAAVAS
ncbi:ABC transporter substrate-binding protein [Sphingomonas sp. FARSPH]|jgi:iron complex transport system substrate-binding protein|nr:ABC transporter substrate-binding protein [Sphingomonas sp. FARSPH]